MDEFKHEIKEEVSDLSDERIVETFKKPKTKEVSRASSIIEECISSDLGKVQSKNKGVSEEEDISVCSKEIENCLEGMLFSEN